MNVDRSAVTRAVAGVEDPEYPGITIDDLGMLAGVDVDVGEAGARVRVDLLPTRLGCPALDLIRRDVEAAVRSVAGVEGVAVRFCLQPTWTPDRIRPAARHALAQRFTVAVPGPDGCVRCPVCGGTDVERVAEVGAAPCRAVARCQSCRSPVDVMRVR